MHAIKRVAGVFALSLAALAALGEPPKMPRARMMGADAGAHALCNLNRAIDFDACVREQRIAFDEISPRIQNIRAESWGSGGKTLLACLELHFVRSAGTWDFVAVQSCANKRDE